jgi:hypothetical protein
MMTLYVWRCENSCSAVTVMLVVDMAVLDGDRLQLLGNVMKSSKLCVVLLVHAVASSLAQMRP